MSSSSNDFCRRSDKILEGIPMQKMVDNILLQGTDKEDALQKLRSTLRACRQNGVVISAKKVEAGQEVIFAGFLLMVEDGKSTIQADPSKCQAIKDMTKPKNAKEVQQFMGMAAQLSKWSPDYVHVSNHIRQLMSGKAAFIWTEKHEEEFNTIKAILGHSLKLAVFDIGLEIECWVDASALHGLSFLLVQVLKDGYRKVIQMAAEC